MNDVKPIRILQVFGEMNLGGAETMIMNIYRNIDRDLVQFDFIVHTDEHCFYDDEIIKLGGRIFKIPKYNVLNHYIYTKEWDRFFSNHSSYNIIHAHLRSTASIYINIAKKYGLNTIVHSHSTSSGKGLKKAIKTILQKNITKDADYLIACSKEAGEWLFGKRQNMDKEIIIINNAINVEKFKFDFLKREQTRKKLGVEGKKVVGHIGRFNWIKNHPKTINVFEKYLVSNPNSVLILVGEGEKKHHIKQIVKNKNMHDKVIFVDSTSEVAQLMCAMDIFIFPSIKEGVPLVLVEAQTNGLPVLTSTSLSKEVEVSELVTFEDLESDDSVWAKHLDNVVGSINRQDAYLKIKNTKFDVDSEKEKILNLYKKILSTGGN